MSEQQQVPPLYEEETETEEQKEKKQRLKTLFADLESKQPDFLDEAGKSMIERIATFLAILFAVTALGSSFPPKYLVGNPRDNYLVIAILLCYLLAMDGHGHVGHLPTHLWSLPVQCHQAGKGMEAPHQPQEVLGAFGRHPLWNRHGGTGWTHCLHHLASLEGDNP